MRTLPTRPPVPCCGLATTVVDDVTAARIAPMFKALGDPVRLRLAALIAGSAEVCVCDLQAHFTLTGPTISHHLRVLREAGLVAGRRRGTWVYYRINPDAIQALTTLLQPAVPAPATAR